MYESRGNSALEIGDLDVVAHQDRLHLFHLTLPNHDLVSRAVSRDGLNWEPAAPALHTGDPGDCDDDMIWTMHTVARPDGRGFHMYYTGCARAEQGNHQRVALATSEDLIHFRKHEGNPVLQPAPPHYLGDRSVNGLVSFRDPFVYIEDGLWHMLVTARENRGPRFRRGCIAHATSPDGMRWELQPPLYAPHRFEDLEVPALLKLGGRYYLFFHDFTGHTRYRIAPSLAGPWEAPLRDTVLPIRNFVFRFCTWRGQPLLLHSMRGECDWRRRQAASGHNVVSPPRRVRQRGDGTLAVTSYEGWSAYHQGAAVTLPAATSLSGGGQHLHLHEPELADFVLETTVQLDRGRAAGLLLRSDPGIEACLWLRLDYGLQQVVLHTHAPYDSGEDRLKLRQREVQSYPATLRHGQPVHVRIIACAQYIEVSLNDEIHLCPLTYQAKRGRCGVWIEDGAGAFGELRVQPLRCPWPVWEKA